MKFTIYGMFLLFVVTGCSSKGQSDVNNGVISVGEISFSDGDSGRLQGVPFRIKSYDAPETGGVGAAIGGAKCERERELGLMAKKFMVSLTQFASIQVTRNYGEDRFGRIVVDLDADGVDVATAGLQAGVLRSWRHDEQGNALEDKPDWCE